MIISLCIISGHCGRLPRPGDHEHHDREAGREGEGRSPAEVGPARGAGQLAGVSAGRLCV